VVFISAGEFEMTHRVCALFISMLVLYGCGEAPEDQVVEPKPSAALQREVAALQDPTLKMARAVGSGKPGAAVELKYDILVKPEPGVATEVNLALIPSASADAMTLKISAMDGITLAGQLESRIEKPQSGKPYEHRFSLLPDQAGIYYATVTVMMEFGDSQMGRTFSIPLLVGSVQQAQKPVAVPPKDATGQAVQSMRAEESKQ
jgi:hypothetical protein